MNMCATYDLLPPLDKVNMSEITYANHQFTIPDVRDWQGRSMHENALSPLPQFVRQDARASKTHKLNSSKLRNLIQDYIGMPPHPLTWKDEVGYVQCSLDIGSMVLSYEGIDYNKLADYVNAHSTTHMIQMQ